MIGRARHLHDERLFDCYMARRAGDQIDPPAAEHLVDCERCGARYEELSRWMETLRTEAVAESDEVFTADRLRHQELQIARRIAQAGRSARVISFPGLAIRSTGISSRMAPRWLVAAAAAGLFVGVAVGGLFDARVRYFRAPMTIVSNQAGPGRLQTASGVRLNPPAASVQAVETVDDDVFLEQLEFALQRPRTRELLPFDALTPHVREISTQQLR
jgi:hypothetical protein